MEKVMVRMNSSPSPRKQDTRKYLTDVQVQAHYTLRIYYYNPCSKDKVEIQKHFFFYLKLVYELRTNAFILLQ